MKHFDLSRETYEQGSFTAEDNNDGAHHTMTETPTPMSGQSRLIPVTRWNDYHVWPPIGGLRHLIFNEETNGFSKCVVRVGRRVLIDEDRFFQWARGNHP